jgi:ABC-type lipoprotein export system ATPase subunit
MTDSARSAIGQAFTRHQPDPGEPILRAVNLNKSYFLGEVIYAVNDVSLAIDKGEFIVIVGPSGCGKTTLLSILGGLDRPNSGEVLLGGQRYSKLNENGLAQLRRNQIGFVFQFFNLISHLTALENVSLPLRFTRMPRRAVRERAEQLLTMVGLGQRASHLPLQMSGGEQQRVAIARALANSPAVILADEPTGNLDSKTKNEMADLFLRLNDEFGQTFVVVSHDEGFARFAHRVLHMRDGKVEKVEAGGR